MQINYFKKMAADLERRGQFDTSAHDRLAELLIDLKGYEVQE